jgi:hypothetical protein
MLGGQDARPLSRGEFYDLPACGFGFAGEHVAQTLMRIDTSSPANFVENGRLVLTLQAHDVARKI